MQLRPQEIKNITKAGFFVGLLLTLCMLFIFFLGKDSSLFNSNLSLKSRFNNVENLKDGAAVYLKGLRIGTVKSIEFKDLSIIELTYIIKASYAPWIRKNAAVFIRTQGMLGDKYLEIDGGSVDQPYVVDGDTLMDGGATGINKFLNQGESIMDKTTNIMAQLNQLLTDINQNNQIGATFKNLQQTSQNFNSLLTQIDGKKINESINNLYSASKKMEEMATRLAQGPGTAHSFIYDNSVYDDLRTLLGGAQRSQVLKYFIRESIKKGTQLEEK